MQALTSRARLRVEPLSLFERSILANERLKVGSLQGTIQRRWVSAPAEYLSDHHAPLRERLDDVPLLVNLLIDRISRRLGKVIKVIPTNVMDALRQYHRPGNVRERENVLERAVINASRPKLRLVDELKRPRKDLAKSVQTLEHVERDDIRRVLEQTGWQVSGKNSTAEILGIDRSTLCARMRKLNIRKP